MPEYIVIANLYEVKNVSKRLLLQLVDQRDVPVTEPILRLLTVSRSNMLVDWSWDHLFACLLLLNRDITHGISGLQSNAFVKRLVVQECTKIKKFRSIWDVEDTNSWKTSGRRPLADRTCLCN